MYNNNNDYSSSSGVPSRTRIRIGAHVAGENKTYVRQVTPLCTVPIQTTATFNIQLFPVPTGTGRTGTSNYAQLPPPTAASATSMDPSDRRPPNQTNNRQSPIRIRASHVGGHARNDRYEYDAASSLSTGSSGGSMDGRAMMTDYFLPVTSGAYMSSSTAVPPSKTSTGSSAGSSLDGQSSVVMTSSDMMTEYSMPVTSGVYMSSSAVAPAGRTSTGSSASSSINGGVSTGMTSSEMMTEYSSPLTSRDGFTSRSSTIYADQMTSSIDLFEPRSDAAIQVTPVLPRGLSGSTQTTVVSRRDSAIQVTESRSVPGSTQTMVESNNDSAIHVTAARVVSGSTQTSVDSSTETHGSHKQSTQQVNATQTQTSSSSLQRTSKTSVSASTSTLPLPDSEAAAATGSANRSVSYLQEERQPQAEHLHVHLQTASVKSTSVDSGSDATRSSRVYDTEAMMAAVEDNPDYEQTVDNDEDEDDDDYDDVDYERYKSKSSTFRFLDWDILSKLKSLGRQGCRRILVFKDPTLVLMIKAVKIQVDKSFIAACITEKAGNHNRLLELMGDIAENCAKRLCLMQNTSMPNVTAKHMATLPLNDGRLTADHLGEVSQVLGETVSVSDIAFRFQPVEPNVYFGTFVKDKLMSRRQYAIGSAGVVTVLTKKNKFATIEAFAEQLCEHIVKTRPSELGAFDGDRRAGRASQVRRKHPAQTQLLLQNFSADPTIVVAEAARRCFVSIDDFLLFD